MTSEPSTICKEGTAERSQVGMASPSSFKFKDGGGQPLVRPMVGHVLVLQPRGENEKMGKGWNHHRGLL